MTPYETAFQEQIAIAQKLTISQLFEEALRNYLRLPEEETTLNTKTP